MERYNIVKKLGEGTFGSVWKATNKKNGEVVAIKAMKRKYYSWEQCLNLPEVKSLRKMNHAHIIKLKEVIREHDTLYCVFEYMDCNLNQIIKCHGKALSEAEVKNRCFQVIQGLAYMHGLGYFHRDLKPENLLVSENVIKIGDLGSARELNSAPPYTNYVTTRWYRAPEVMLCSEKYGSAVDMWAMGAIMAELFTSRPLFPGSSTLDQMYKICEVIGTPTKSNWVEGLNLASAVNYHFPQCNGVPFAHLIPSANADAINLITALCSWDPCKRPTALEALRHPFFKSCYAVPPTLGYWPSVNRMPTSAVTMPAIEKMSYPLHFGIPPDLRPACINYPSNPQMFTPGVPYKVVVNNQGINKKYNFSKAVARPNSKYHLPHVTDKPGCVNQNEITREVSETREMLANMSFTNGVLGGKFDNTVLNVGEELWKETLPLQMGSRLYQLEGLKPNTWYEVKISYPASIPSSFSLLLRRGNSSKGKMQSRKLLNTEKLFFKTDDLDSSYDQDKWYVFVTVEPAGVVAIPHVKERNDVIFNIVCDELLYGIPRYTWSVVIFVVLCLGLALVVPFFLPPYLLGMDRSSNLAAPTVSKDS